MRRRRPSVPRGAEPDARPPGAPAEPAPPGGPGPAAPEEARFLDGLVRVVLALDGDRAASLLAGLAEEPHRGALALLGSLERKGRAERHAELAMAFGSSSAAAAAEGIPGPLGARVRALLTPGDAPATTVPRSMERWARRLALECTASGPEP